MADNENDELSHVKEWFRANGMALVVGGALGLAVIVGWQWWSAHNDSQAREAANLYGEVTARIADGSVGEEALAGVERLKDDYAGTPYAANVALRLAAHQVENSQYDEAVAQLDWAADNAADAGVRHIARVRQARLLWSQGDADAALELLTVDHPEQFTRLYAELAGDIHAAEGDRAEAYAAYQRAAGTLTPNADRGVLERKLTANAPANETTDSPSTSAAEEPESTS